MSDKPKKASKEITHSKKCFFITPIGDQKSNEFEKLEGLIENVLNPVLEEKNYEIIVAHQIQNLGSINDQIFKNIIESDLIITNLTGLNANVMYETAVAHSFGKPTIMISESGTNLPFDLKIDRTIFFNDSIKGTGLLKKEILGKITQLEGDSNTDNPIVRVIQSSKLNEQLNKENLSEDETIMKMILDLSQKIDKLNQNTHDTDYGNLNIINKFRIRFMIKKEYLQRPETRAEQLLNYAGILEANIINIKASEKIDDMRRVIVEVSTYIDDLSKLTYIIQNCFGKVHNLRILKNT